MEAVQGLLKGSIWTQNGVSAAQLNGNMYLSVWKGMGERRGRALGCFKCCGGIENWVLFSECLGECRDSQEQLLVVQAL